MSRGGEFTRGVVTFDGEAGGLQRAAALGRAAMQDLSRAATDGASQMSAAWAAAAAEGFGTFQAKAKSAGSEMREFAAKIKADRQDLAKLESQGALTAAGRGFDAAETDEYLRRLRDLNFAQKEFAEAASKPTMMAGSMLEYAQAVEGAKAMLMGFRGAQEQVNDAGEKAAAATRAEIAAVLSLIEAEERAAALAKAAGQDPEKAVAAARELASTRAALAAATARMAAGERSAEEEVRKLTAAVQQQQIALGESTSQAGGMSNRIGQMSMQAVMAADDFMTMYQATGKLSDGLRGAGNNLTAMMMPLGTVPTLMATFATSAGFAFAKYIEGSKDAQEAAEKNIERMKELAKLSREEGMSKRQQGMQADMKAMVELRAAMDKARKSAVTSVEDSELRAATGKGYLPSTPEEMAARKAAAIDKAEFKFGGETMGIVEAQRRLREMERQSKIEQTKALADELRETFKGGGGVAEGIRSAITEQKLTPQQAEGALAARLGGMPGMDRRFVARLDPNELSAVEMVARDARREVEKEIRAKQLNDAFFPDRDAEDAIRVQKAKAKAAEDAVRQAERDARGPASDRGQNVSPAERQLIDALSAQAEAMKAMTGKMEEDLQERRREREETLRQVPLGPIEPAGSGPGVRPR